MTYKERFASNLRRIRTDAGLSQEELGDRCDLHRTEISLLERAGREPRLATLERLIAALDTNYQALTEGLVWDTDSGDFKVTLPAKR